jgi:site-specific recombinase XerD
MFLAEFAETHKPATVQTRYKCLRLFFTYLLEEGEVTKHPMANMKPPSIPETPVPVFDKSQHEALLKVADGKDFVSRRDSAILRLYTGMRRGELAGLTVENLDFEADVDYVIGKGPRPRACPFGAKTGLALDRYLRERAKRPQGDVALPWLWLGKKGRLGASGVLQMVTRFGEEAGLGRIHPHQLRHALAHAWLADGGNEGDLMRLAGRRWQ